MCTPGAVSCKGTNLVTCKQDGTGTSSVDCAIKAPAGMNATCGNNMCQFSCAGDTWVCDGKCIAAGDQCHNQCNPANRTTCRSVCLPLGTSCPGPVPLIDYTRSFTTQGAGTQTDHALLGISDAGVLPVDVGGDTPTFARHGTIGHALTSEVPGRTVPLLLFFNDDPLIVDSWTTTDRSPGAGYRMLSVEGHIYKNPEPGTKPLKLFFSAFNNDHLTTTGNPGGDYGQGQILGYVEP
jgi:hypothetical protein